MRLSPTRPTRPTRPFPVADRFADGTPVVDYHPRLKAIEWLRGKVADRQAETCPDTPTDLLVTVGQHETRWANIAANLVGIILDRATLPGGGECLRVVPEADVRIDVGLGELPSAQSLAMDAILAAMPPAPRASLALIESAQRATKTEPETLMEPAMRAAHDAWERHPKFHLIEGQLSVGHDGDTEGVA